MKRVVKKHEINSEVDLVLQGKHNRDRIASVLIAIIIIGTAVVMTGVYFLVKQQKIIEQNQEIDWMQEYQRMPGQANIKRRIEKLQEDEKSEEQDSGFKEGSIDNENALVENGSMEELESRN